MAPEIILFNIDGKVANSEEFKEVVPLLFNKGYHLVAFSKKNMGEIESYLAEKNICDYFEFNHSTVQNNPDFTKVLEYFNKNPSVIVYVGESLEEMKIAEERGFGFIALTTGVNSKEDFNGAGCYIVLNSLSDLV